MWVSAEAQSITFEWEAFYNQEEVTEHWFALNLAIRSYSSASLFIFEQSILFSGQGLNQFLKTRVCWSIHLGVWKVQFLLCLGDSDHICLTLKCSTNRRVTGLYFKRVLGWELVAINQQQPLVTTKQLIAVKSNLHTCMLCKHLCIYLFVYLCIQ